MTTKNFTSKSYIFVLSRSRTRVKPANIQSHGPVKWMLLLWSDFQPVYGAGFKDVNSLLI